VDLNEFRRAPLPGGVPLVVLPARMLWDKGVGEFVQAARSLAEKRANVRFALVGGVDMKNPAAVPEATLRGWVKEGIIEWWGSRSDMPAVLAQSTIVCLPSYREGMPKALLEACVVGRPIVTTDVPGCRDVVQRPVYGLPVPVRNGCAMPPLVEELIADRPRLEDMSESSAIAGLEYGIESVIAQTVSTYGMLLAAIG